jgi:hypothetical protein
MPATNTMRLVIRMKKPLRASVEIDVTPSPEPLRVLRMAVEALAPFANYACPPGSGLCACHNCTARTALSAARSYLASPVAQSDADLHAQIMNIPCGQVPFPYRGEVDEEKAYRLGHRDARHAAAELVASAASLRSQPDTQGGDPAASPVDGKTASTEGVPGMDGGPSNG